MCYCNLQFAIAILKDKIWYYLTETETLLAELSKHEIEVDSGVRLSVCGQVLESSDFESLKHPHWLNDKVELSIMIGQKERIRLKSSKLSFFTVCHR